MLAQVVISAIFVLINASECFWPHSTSEGKTSGYDIYYMLHVVNVYYMLLHVVNVCIHLDS